MIRSLNYLLLGTFSVFLFISCKGKNTNEDNLSAKHTIQVGKAMDSTIALNNYSGLFRLDSIVPLETNRLCLIRKIDKLVAYGDYYYILDIASGQILKFNKGGRFYAKFSANTQGGKNNLKNIHDFCIINKDLLVAYSGDEKKLLYLDEQLKPNQEKYVSFRFRSFVFNPQSQKLYFDIGYFANLNFKGEQLIITDTAFHVESQHLPSPTIISWFFNSADENGKLQANYQHERLINVSYMPFYKSYIFQFIDNKPFPEYYLDFGRTLLGEKNVLEYQKSGMAINDVYDKDVIHSIGYANSNHLLALSFSYQKQIYQYFYRKDKDKGFLVKAPSDPSCGCGTLLTYKGFDDNKLVLVSAANNLSEFLKSTSFSPKNDLKNVQSSDNPILFLVE